MRNEFQHFTFILLKKKQLVKKKSYSWNKFLQKKQFRNDIKIHVLDLLDKHTWELLHQKYLYEPSRLKLLAEGFVKQLLEKPHVNIAADPLKKKNLCIPLVPTIFCFPKFWHTHVFQFNKETNK
jgi:hypothetical protein